MSRTRLFLFVFLSLSVVSATDVNAGAVVGLDITGIISFSNGLPGDPRVDRESFVIGAGVDEIQTGSYTRREGDPDDVVTHTYSNARPTVPGTRAIAGVLTHHGDGGGVGGALSGNGFGGTATADVERTFGPDVDNVNFRAAIDLDDTQASQALFFDNTSPTQAYRVDLILDYAHGVNATASGGAAAFVDSDLDLVIAPGTAMEQVFESEISSDTRPGVGNMENDASIPGGTPGSGVGGPVTRSGTVPFSFVVAPGQGVAVLMDYTLRGRVFSTVGAGTASAVGGATGTIAQPNHFFLSLDNVTPVPEPNAALFMCLACVGFAGRRFCTRFCSSL